MPLKHSPPMTDPELRATRTFTRKNLAAQQSDTDPPMTASEEDVRAPVKTVQRAKRKHEGKDESESRSVLIEMRILFANMAAEQEKKLDNLQKRLECIDKFSDELLSIRSNINEGRKEVGEFIQSCGARMDVLEARMLVIEQKQEDKVTEPSTLVENVVAQLKQQLNERDQELLLNDIEVSNVPEISGESPLHVIKRLSTSLGVDIDDRDIVHVERVGSTRRNREEAALPRPRTLVVRLARHSTRDQLLRAARVRRGLTTAALDINVEPPRNVYVNERLTRTNRQLFGRVREQARRLGWKNVWTKDGKIFTRKDDGRQVERI